MPRTRRRDKHPLRPSTKVLTEGFDPTLSLGSARPAVFRSSTYVFSSPEAAEHAFNVTSGRAPPARRRRAGPDLLALQPSQRADARGPNREPRKRLQIRAGLQLRHGCDHHIAFRSFAPGQSIVYTVPIYGGTQHFIQDCLSQWGISGTPVFSGDAARISRAIASAKISAL